MCCCYSLFSLEAYLHLPTNMVRIFFSKKQIVLTFQLSLPHMNKDVLPLNFYTMKSQKRIQYGLVKDLNRGHQGPSGKSVEKPAKLVCPLQALCSICHSEVHLSTRHFCGNNVIRVKINEQKHVHISTSAHAQTHTHLLI